MTILRPHRVRVFSAWLVNLSAGWFASVFFLLGTPRLLIFSMVLAILCLYFALLLEKERGKNENYRY